MNINILLSNYSVSLFRESVLPSLTYQQKKILFIASIIFGFLSTCYVVRRCCFKAKVLNGQGVNSELFGLIVREGEFKDGELNGQGKHILNIFLYFLK